MNDENLNVIREMRPAIEAGRAHLVTVLETMNQVTGILEQMKSIDATAVSEGARIVLPAIIEMQNSLSELYEALERLADSFTN